MLCPHLWECGAKGVKMVHININSDTCREKSNPPQPPTYMTTTSLASGFCSPHVCNLQRCVRGRTELKRRVCESVPALTILIRDTTIRLFVVLLLSNRYNTTIEFYRCSNCASPSAESVCGALLIIIVYSSHWARVYPSKRQTSLYNQYVSYS